MNPIGIAELTALLSEELGSLKPYQIEQLRDALNRRVWEHGTPVNGYADQLTLATIVAAWQS